MTDQARSGVKPNRKSEAEAAHSFRGQSLEDVQYVDVIASVQRHAAHTPNNPYLTFANAEPWTTLTYGQLEDYSARFASWLRSAGVRDGERVALIPTMDPSSVVAIFGALRAGVTVGMLNPSDPPARQRELIRGVGTEVVLSTEAVSAGNTMLLPRLDRLPDRARGDPEQQPRLRDAFILGTSGSTAASKLVVQSQANVAANAEALRRHHRLRPGRPLLGCLPIHHVNGLHFSLLATAHAGAHAVLLPRFDPFGYMGALTRVRPRIASVVPSILEALLALQRSVRLDWLDYFVSAAAPLRARTAQDVHRLFGTRVLQGYGLSETTNFSTTMPTQLSEDAYRSLMLDADIPSVGVPVFANEVAVLRSDGRPAGPGEPGEVCMRGHNIMSRYEGNASDTREAFRNGWFHSQDLGYARRLPGDERDFFVLTGRIKNIAKVGGETISLDELERLLLRDPRVRDTACVVRPDRLLGDEIVALIALADARPVDAREVLAGSVAPAALPRRTVFVDAIPRTSTGKLIRRALSAALDDAAPTAAQSLIEIRKDV